MATSPNSDLGAPALFNLMVKSLPPKAFDESSPVVKDSYAAIALFAHACMLAAGFRLVGLGEDQKIGKCSVLDHIYVLIGSRCAFGVKRRP